MVNLNEYIEKLKTEYDIKDPNFNLEFSRFLVTNNWFRLKYEIREDSVYIDNTISKHVTSFCRFYNTSIIEKTREIKRRLAIALPETAAIFDRYCRMKELTPEMEYYISDFLLYYLAGELLDANDTEISHYMEDAFDNLNKTCGDKFADFVNWTRHKNKKRAAYRKDYYMTKRASKTAQASSITEYLKILYHFFNTGYIEDNGMYAKAAKSKNYTDTWLFIALHFVCALRRTDLIRITHPRLPDTPENVLKQIKAGTFSDTDAKSVLYSILWRMNALMLKPNKTQKHNVPSLKIHIPVTVETHFGILFAAAEAHYRLTQSEGPLIREVTTYQQITRYMGEEIGNLFLTANFKSRAANKSFLQMIQDMTSDILGEDEFNPKGYLLASLARSHKDSYGDFAKTTIVYLRDMKMNGYTPEFVARELIERGVLSFMPSMLLKMVTDGEYNKLSVENQTKLIKKLNMNPLEIERAVSLAKDTEKQSAEIVQALYQSRTPEEVLTILHRVGNGEAVSKQTECLCLMTAMHNLCPYDDRKSCIGCQYEISTKSTLVMMVSEMNRLKDLYKTTTNPVNKQKYKVLITDVVAPAMSEMLECMGREYGTEIKEELEGYLG